MKVKDAIKLIEDDGWYLWRHKGTGHRQYKHETKLGKVTVSGKLSQDLKKGTENNT
jgi:predicted RNA binding protein YcfA (HicA-like mRNA interferase family)